MAWCDNNWGARASGSFLLGRLYPDDFAAHKHALQMHECTKARQRSAEAVWKAVAGSEGLGKHPLLVECGKVWETASAGDEGEGVEKMARINLKVADRMAGE